MNKKIAVTIGDLEGVGIELLLKIWLSNKYKNFVLFTNHEIIRKYIYKNNYKIKINIVNKDKKNIIYKKNFLNIFSFKSNSNEENTVKSLNLAYKECVKNNFIGIVTLPLRKDLIIKKINHDFIGHTEYFQKIDKKKFANMILFHKKIIITTLTTHINLKKIVKVINKKNFIYDNIINLQKTLIKDFNIKKPKLIVSGINPHAGENGYIGLEENNIIKPQIQKLKRKNIIIDGPVSADSMLIINKKYDCYIFIYHDQALIPFKYISKFSGVNYTGNLSIIRTSPDHGTAYSLKGSKKLSNKSLLNCFKLVKKIHDNRKNY